jgi:hypothetical protein
MIAAACGHLAGHLSKETMHGQQFTGEGVIWTEMA